MDYDTSHVNFGQIDLRGYQRYSLIANKRNTLYMILILKNYYCFLQTLTFEPNDTYV